MGYESDINLNNVPLIGDFPVKHNIGGFGIATGINNYEVHLNTPITSYRQGLHIIVIFQSPNSGPCNLKVDSAPIAEIKKIVDGEMVDLSAGDILSNIPYPLVYNEQILLLQSPSSLNKSIPQATEAVSGLIEIASQAEVNAGTDNTRAVTSQKLAQYVSDKITGLWEDKGIINCSANLNYPPGQKGDAFTVSVAGKIGGVNGKEVQVRDVIYCTNDNPGGDEATVGAYWNVIQSNLIQATEAIAGFVKIATQTETNTGDNDAAAITPLKLKTLLDGRVAKEDITGLAEIATSDEVKEATDDERIVTPLKLALAFSLFTQWMNGAGLNSILPRNALNNSAAGSHATVLNGENNKADADFSLASGRYAEAFMYGSTAHAAGGFFNKQGSAQRMFLQAWTQVFSGMGTVVINLDGTGGLANRWVVPFNSLQHFLIFFDIVQHSGLSGSAGHSWVAIYEGAVKNSNGVVSWLGTPPNQMFLRNDAALTPTVAFSINGSTVTPTVQAIANKNLFVHATVQITQTKFQFPIIIEPPIDPPPPIEPPIFEPEPFEELLEAPLMER